MPQIGAFLATKLFSGFIASEGILKAIAFAINTAVMIGGSAVAMKMLAPSVDDLGNQMSFGISNTPTKNPFPNRRWNTLANRISNDILNADYFSKAY